MTYRVLDMKPIYHFGDQPIYKVMGFYPWYKVLDLGFSNPKHAHLDAVCWCAEYESSDDRRKAVVHGITQDTNGRWHGVVNYFHSIH